MNWSKEGYERILEASKRGRKTQLERHKRNYYENQKVCPNCGELIPWEKRENKFCDSSCSASYNNKGKSNKGKGKPRKEVKKSGIRIEDEERYCQNCERILEKTQKKYCCNQCQSDFQYREYIKKWKDGEVSGNQGEGSISSHIKRYILEEYGHRCSICGMEEWMGEKVPLILDHIDGNSENNTEENLRYVCGNCDMQLSTYKSKNKGNGRHYRRKRYEEGKSY